MATSLTGIEGLPDDLQEPVDFFVTRAKELVYGPGFESMIEGLQGSNARKFGATLSQMVVPMMDKIEAEYGKKLDQPQLQAAGAAIVGMIFSDLVDSKIIDATEDHFVTAAILTMTEWMSRHPDRMDSQQLFDQAKEADMLPSGQSEDEIRAAIGIGGQQQGVGPAGGQQPGRM